MGVGCEGYLAGALHACVQVLELGCRGLHIEVSGQNHRVSFRIDFGYTIHDQFKAVFTGFHADMVQMGVNEVKTLPCAFILHQGPCCGAVAGSVPSFRWFLRSFREPESAPFHKLDGLLVPEDGHKLTFLLSIITTYTYIVIVISPLFKKQDLIRQGLLYAQNVRILILDHLQSCRTTVFPCIGTVLICAEPYVVRHDLQLLRLSGSKLWQQKRCHNEYIEKSAHISST